MSEIRVVSVPHTGTHFTMKVLGLHEHMHWNDHRVPELLNDSRVKIVVPVRAVSAVIETAKKRGNTVEDIIDGLGVVMGRTWRRHPRVHYFVVDCPDELRQIELANLSTFVGYECFTDWVPVGTTEELQT